MNQSTAVGFRIRAGGLLCCESRGRIAGVLGYEFEPEPMYLQTTAFLAWENRVEAYAAYVSHLRERFSGYTALCRPYG